MALIIKLILESFRFAWNALTSNLLRTFLSLLGVTIGIFAIISVFTLVDSLETSIKSSLSFLGTNNITVDKFPYEFGNGQYPWWKYVQRPNPTYNEYQFLTSSLTNASDLTISANRGGVTAKYKSSSSTGVNLMGVVYEHKNVFEIPIVNGRYFTPDEASSGRNVAVIGHRIKDDLFQDLEPLGRQIKIKGLNFYIIGVMEEEGESFIGTPSHDDQIYLPFKSFSKLYRVARRYGIQPTITLKGFEEDIGLVELESELRGLMRIKRGLKPKEGDSFALNRPEAISNFIGSTFDIIGIAGWVIGGFSILVGGFGIANIMFVSVRERTSIIGIQKSLGAKNYFILFQFLFEAIFLSVLGGAFGILLVYLLSFISLGSLDLVLTISNIFLGIGVSASVGVISGIVPAAMASRLDPVIAIRS